MLREVREQDFYPMPFYAHFPESKFALRIERLWESMRRFQLASGTAERRFLDWTVFARPRTSLGIRRRNRPSDCAGSWHETSPVFYKERNVKGSLIRAPTLVSH